MGRYVFRLPDIGEGVAEAEIVVWHIKPGDSVQEDQSIVDVMTDKATVDMTSPVDGVVIAIHGEVGSMLPVGAALVELEVAGYAGDAAPPAAVAAPVASVTAPAPARVADAAPPPPVAAPGVGSRTARPVATPAFTTRAAGAAPLASPATRRRAHELGVGLQYVAASGPAGRVTAQDLDDHVASGGTNGQRAGPAAPRTGVAETRIIGMRRRIAEKMQEAKRRIPHIAYVEEIDLTQLEGLRVNLNEHRADDQPKLTLLPFFMRALVKVLPDYPHVNAHYDDEGGVLHQFEGIHIGIATQTPAGLVVPVVRHAEALDIWASAAELARLSAAARDGSARREELTGSTITITSLGLLGGVTTTPIINHPEVAIIGPNKVADRPVVHGSFLSVRKMMNMSCSFDHRIVDGYDAALFVQAVKRQLEHPALLFME